jgi:hypothetical protein
MAGDSSASQHLLLKWKGVHETGSTPTTNLVLIKPRRGPAKDERALNNVCGLARDAKALSKSLVDGSDLAEHERNLCGRLSALKRNLADDPYTRPVLMAFVSL